MDACLVVLRLAPVGKIGGLLEKGMDMHGCFQQYLLVVSLLIGPAASRLERYTMSQCKHTFLSGHTQSRSSTCVTEPGTDSADAGGCNYGKSPCTAVGTPWLV